MRVGLGPGEDSVSPASRAHRGLEATPVVEGIEGQGIIFSSYHYIGPGIIIIFLSKVILLITSECLNHIPGVLTKPFLPHHCSQEKGVLFRN